MPLVHLWKFVQLRKLCFSVQNRTRGFKCSCWASHVHPFPCMALVSFLHAAGATLSKCRKRVSCAAQELVEEDTASLGAQHPATVQARSALAQLTSELGRPVRQPPQASRVAGAFAGQKMVNVCVLLKSVNAVGEGHQCIYNSVSHSCKLSVLTSTAALELECNIFLARIGGGPEDAGRGCRAVRG